MAAKEYLDFDLELSPGTDGRCEARVLESPKGEATHQFTVPCVGADLENVILKLGRTRSGVRHLGSPQQELAKGFGTRLYDAVFDGEVGTCFRRSLDAAEAEGKGLRVKLRLADAPGLGDIPWEFLYSTGLGRFLVLSGRTPLVRYLDLPRAVAPLTVTPPLRILVAVAGPRNLAVLDSEAEVARIQAALGELVTRGWVTVEPLPRATLATLRQALRRADYHVLHFIGHGGFDPSTGDGLLAFEDDQGLAHQVSGGNLGTLLHEHDSLRLAVLNACEGARHSATDPFSGVAQSLVRQGLPAVVAMQFEITDTAATTFAVEFYAAMADGYPIDAAIAQGRLAVFSTDNDVEWGTPVLYLRARDGRIFDVPAGAKPAPAPTRPGGAPAPTGEPVPARPAPTGGSRIPPVVVEVPLEPTIEVDIDIGDVAAGDVPAPTAYPPVVEPDGDQPPPGEAPSTLQPQAPRSRVWLVAAAVVAVLVLGFVAVRSFIGTGTPVDVVTTTGGQATESGNQARTTTTAQGTDVPRLGLVSVVRGTARVDGNPAEWGNATAFPGNELVAGRETGVRAAWRLMADEEAFYALAEVRDATLRPPDPKEPATAWKGDSVSFELGPSGISLKPTDGPRSNDAHYLFGITSAAGAALTCVNPSDTRGKAFVAGAPNGKITAVWRPTDDGYLVEVKLPWSVTGVPGPHWGHTLNANFNVSDAGSGGELAGMHSSNPRREASVQAYPVYWQPLYLG